MGNDFHTRNVTVNFVYRFGGYKDKERKKVDTSRFGHWKRGGLNYFQEIIVYLQQWEIYNTICLWIDNRSIFFDFPYRPRTKSAGTYI